MTVLVQARGIVKRDIEKTCPPSSSGEYPNCVCESGAQFNEIHNVCPPRSLESLAGSCPDDSTGEIYQRNKWSLSFNTLVELKLSYDRLRLSNSINPEFKHRFETIIFETAAIRKKCVN